MRFSMQAVAATIGATVALAAVGGGVAVADDHAGGYRVCATGQQVIIDVTWYGTLDVSFWSGSTDPHRHVHYQQTVGEPQSQLVPTSRQAASWATDAGGTAPQIVSARTYCDG